MARPSWRPPLPIDSFDLAVLGILEDAQTHDRSDLATTLHTSIRQVRRSISELRTLGWPIGYGEKWIDSKTDTYTNTAKASLEAFSALIADVRAARQIKG